MAEVEGRKPDAVNVEPAPEMHCNTCPGVQARSFCVDCHEYLCTDCTGYHQRLNALKGHKLLMGDNFPSVEPPQRQAKAPDTFVTCPDHPKEEIKFYCQRHEALCCGVCNVINHEQCTKAYIPDIANDFKSGPEFSTLNTNIQDTDQLIVKSLDDIDDCLKAVDAFKVDEIEKLRKYKAKIIEYLDRRELELQADMQQFHDQDVTLLQNLQRKMKTCQSVLSDMNERLKSHEKNSIELYISAKRASGQITNLQSSLQEMVEKIGYRRYSIVRDTRIETMLLDKAGFAGVELVGDEELIYAMSAAKLNQLPRTQFTNKAISEVVSMSSSKILMRIFNERKVLLAESETGQVLSEIVVQDSPRSLCMTSTHLAAATLANETIQFIQVSENTLEEDSTVNIGVNVYGIAAHRNNLVVSCVPPAVMIISKDGEVIHKLDNQLAGREVFKTPRYITTSSDGSIFVADFRKNTISRLDGSLTILQTLSGPLLNSPHGIIAINRDKLLVCNKSNNNIVEIRPSSDTMTILLEKQHGIDYPINICLCKKQKKVYVVSEKGNVMIYKLE